MAVATKRKKSLPLRLPLAGSLEMKYEPQSETSNSQQLLGCQVTDRSEDGPQPPACVSVTCMSLSAYDIISLIGSCSFRPTVPYSVVCIFTCPQPVTPPVCVVLICPPSSRSICVLRLSHCLAAVGEEKDEAVEGVWSG